MGWVDAAVALLLGSSCAGCDRPGRPWCPECLAELEASVAPCLLPGEPPTIAVSPYSGCVPQAVVGFKDRGVTALADPLAHMLALGVLELAEAGAEGLLVPAPSAPAAVRRRGMEHTWELTRRAAQTVVRPCRRLLTSAGRRDQAGLSAQARSRNLEGRMRVRETGCGPVVVIDDVRTSGATLAECDRALREGGYVVTGHVVLAAAGGVTRRAAGVPQGLA